MHRPSISAPIQQPRCLHRPSSPPVDCEEVVDDEDEREEGERGMDSDGWPPRLAWVGVGVTQGERG